MNLKRLSCQGFESKSEYSVCPKPPRAKHIEGSNRYHRHSYLTMIGLHQMLAGEFRNSVTPPRLCSRSDSSWRIFLHAKRIHPKDFARGEINKPFKMRISF